MPHRPFVTSDSACPTCGSRHVVCLLQQSRSENVRILCRCLFCRYMWLR